MSDLDSPKFMMMKQAKIFQLGSASCRHGPIVHAPSAVLEGSLGRFLRNNRSLSGELPLSPRVEHASKVAGLFHL